jgi:hypothetical protein
MWGVMGGEAIRGSRVSCRSLEVVVAACMGFGEKHRNRLHGLSLMLERQKNIQNSKKAIKCARETKPSLAIQAHQKKT